MGADPNVVKLLHSNHRVLNVLRDDKIVVDTVVACRELGRYHDATNECQPACGVKLGRRHVEITADDPRTLQRV